MNKLIISFSICVLGIVGVQAQTTFTANNNPGATGGVNVFTGATALTDAMAAASNGDVIYLVPSPTSYGDMTIAKQLTLFGGGFNPDKDNPEITFIGSSSMNIAASNVRISGLTIAGIVYMTGAINNIVIDKCTLRQLINSGGAAQGNILFQNNIIGQNIAVNQYVMNFGLVSSGIIISNNLIYNNLSAVVGLIHTSNGTMVENNIFIGASGSAINAFDNFNSGTVKNNIFYGVQPNAAGGGTFTNNNFEFNISFGSADDVFPTTNGNSSLSNLESEDPLFTNLPYGTSYSFSYDPTPLAGSMAFGNGEAGTDIGIFGGGSPFDINGTPLPLVQVIDLPPSISQGTDLPVNIKARGN